MQLRNKETGCTLEVGQSDKEFFASQDYKKYNQANERQVNTSDELIELFIVDCLGLILLTVDFESVLHFIETGYVIIAEAVLTTLLITYTFFKILRIVRGELKNVKNKNPEK